MTLLYTAIDGLDALIDDLEALERRAPNAQASEVRAAGKQYLATLRRLTPEHSGNLRGNYATDEQQTATSASFTITNDTPYIGYVINGRGPVVAKAGKMLRFPIGGRVLYRKRVGPAKANPFPDKAASAMASSLSGLGERIARRIVEGR